MNKRRWIAPAGLMLVLLLASAAVYVPYILFGAAFFGALTLIALRQDFRPRSKYDLKGLQDFEDRLEIENLPPDVGVFQFEEYLCHYCRHRFSSEFRACPKCGRTRQRF